MRAEMLSNQGRNSNSPPSRLQNSQGGAFTPPPPSKGSFCLVKLCTSSPVTSFLPSVCFPQSHFVCRAPSFHQPIFFSALVVHIQLSTGAVSADANQYTEETSLSGERHLTYEWRNLCMFRFFHLCERSSPF